MLFVCFAMVMALAAMAEAAATFNPFQHTIVWQNVSSIGKFTMKKPGNGITHPGDYAHNPVLQEGDEITVSWTTVLPFIDLLLLQPALDGSDNAIELISNLPSSKLSTFNWQVSGQTLPGGATPIGQMYYIMVRNASDPNQFFTCSFFNVTSKDADKGNDNPTTTSAAPQSTVTIIENYREQTSTASTPSPTHTDGVDAAKSTNDAAQPAGAFTMQEKSQSTKLSAGAIGGIVAAIVVVALAAAAGIAWRLWWIPRKKKATEAATVSFPPEYWASEKDPYPTWEPPTYHESVREARPQGLALPNPAMLEQGAGVMVHEIGPATPKAPLQYIPYRHEPAPPMPTTPKSPGGPVELP